MAAFFDAGMGRSLLVLVYINLNMGSTLLSAGLDPLDKQEDTGYREIPAPDTSGWFSVLIGGGDSESLSNHDDDTEIPTGRTLTET